MAVDRGVARDIVSSRAVDLAAAIASGDLKSIDVVEAHLERIARKNAEINAVVCFDAERARREARRADEERARGALRGPLHGVPMTVKDTFDTAGMTTTVGLPWLRKNVPTDDAAIVQALRDAGAIVFGKTNCPFASYDWQCVHPSYGRTNNPWRVDCGPGGSSGGSAAALAAKMTPIEIGSDVAGSIRVPAHFCGVVGLRPTEGVVDVRGHGHVPGSPDAFKHFVACGPMARTVADVRLALQCVWKPRPSELPLQRGTSDPFALRGARFCVTTEWGGVRPDRDTVAAMDRLSCALEAAGARIDRRPPAAFDPWEGYRVWGQAHGFEYRAVLPLGGVGPLAWVARGLMHARLGGPLASYVGRGITSSSKAYFHALDRREELMTVLDTFLAGCDAWILPVASTPAFTHRRTGAAIEVDGEKTPYSLANGFFSCPTALTGHPSLALPIAVGSSGLPIGVQIQARRGEDFKLLDVAEAIERVCPAPPLPD